MLTRIKKEVQKVINSLGYKIVVEDKALEKDFLDIYEKCKKYTMTSIERMYSLYKAVEYVSNAGIRGDLVECGVWRGGSAMIIALTLKKMNITDKKIYLYDTYEGMSRPTKEDRDLIKNSSAEERWRKKEKEIMCSASLEDVQQNMSLTGYPKENIIFVKGKVEDTLSKKSPSKIALLRLDTDWYESTRHELNWLYPKIVKKGILILDDYGHWAGSKKAVDEYFKDKPVLLNRIDYSGRIVLKV